MTHEQLVMDPESLLGRGPRNEPSFKMSTGQLAMVIFLSSLAVLFAASLVAYFFVRFEADVWRANGTPHLPWGLAVSTLLIAGASLALHRALASVQKNALESLLRWLVIALLLGFGFMLVQFSNWRGMAPVTNADHRSLYLATFYMLTGLHALHVVGGFIPLAVNLVRARRKEYSSSRYDGLRFTTQYWDFLGVVWLVLLGVIYLGS